MKISIRVCLAGLFLASAFTSSQATKSPQVHGSIATTFHKKERRGLSHRQQVEQRIPRGGASIANTLPNALAGTAAFALIERVVKICFQAADFQYPAALGACILLFTSLCITDTVAPSIAASVFDALSPGAAILAKWFPVFFVPGLALLPLSPPIGGTMDILKIVVTVAIGFVYSLATTLGGVVAVRNLQGKGPTRSSSTGKRKELRKSGSPFSDDQWSFCWKAAIVTGVASIGATQLDVKALVSPLQMTFTFLLTIASFIGATRLPTGFTKVVHPLVTSSAIVLSAIRCLAAVNGQDFLQVLRTYKAGSLNPTKAGAADYLLYILGPSVVSFAISVYSRKEMLFSNLPMVLTAMIVSSAGGLFATGAFVRLLAVGGKTGNAALVRLSILGRNVTTALAMALTQMVGGDLSIVAAVVCLTGILGASYGIPLLNAMGVNDPILRGLGMGSSAQGLGVTAIAAEPDAFPFASVSMVLTAVCATTMTSIPFIRNALIQTTLGSLQNPVAA